MLIERILGVLKLDINTFEDIEHDQNATMQAAIVVIAAAVLSGIGSGLEAEVGFISVFIGVTIWAVIAWFLWSALTYFIGTNLFGGKADMGEMLRVIGFAQAPQMLNILGFIPILGGIIRFVTGIWALVTAFIAVRQGLDIDNIKTAITVLIGWLVMFIGSLIVAGLVAGAAVIGGALGG
ncbi:MAG: YIP1 family protein [Chloroflexota bacterium]